MAAPNRHFMEQLEAHARSGAFEHMLASEATTEEAVAATRVGILGEKFGAAGRDLAKAANGRLDMQGHNMMQENVAFGDDADDGRD